MPYFAKNLRNSLLNFWTKIWGGGQKINFKLAKFGIIQSDEQYVFTYIDMKGNVNSPLHSDYLNNKMKSVKRRHPELKHETPHKLRHTGETLAK